MLEEEYRHRDDYFIFRTIIRRRINELARERERERLSFLERGLTLKRHATWNDDHCFTLRVSSNTRGTRSDKRDRRRTTTRMDDENELNAKKKVPSRLDEILVITIIPCSNYFSNIELFCVYDFPESRSVGYLNCQKVTYPCKNCGKVYNYYSSLARHLKHECGVEPKFHCPLCPYRTKHKSSLNTHLNGRHMKLLSEFYTMPNGNKLSSTMDTGN